MDYQFIGFSIILGLSLFTNCIYCYKGCKKHPYKQQNKIKKQQELVNIASDLPQWVINEYLANRSV